MARKHFLAERYMKVQNGLLQSCGILVLLVLQEDGMLYELVCAPVFDSAVPFTAVSGFLVLSSHLLALQVAGREKDNITLLILYLYFVCLCIRCQSNEILHLAWFVLSKMHE